TRAGRPPGRRPGSRAASESALTTEGTLWVRACARPVLLGGVLVSMHAQPARGLMHVPARGGSSQVLTAPVLMRIFPRHVGKPASCMPFTSLILFPVMLPIKSVACSCPKGGKLMKRALIGGLSVLAMIVGVSAANAQANINPNVYPGNTSERYGAQAP